MVSIIDKNRDELIELCRAHHVKRLDVFGSAATGDFDSISDIDFLVSSMVKSNDKRRMTLSN